MPENASKQSAEKPLQGARICCTSIPPEYRTQLAEWAVEMGAEHTLDLTSDVTHLLVGDTQSQKYQYVAREREDVKVLLPDFMQALRELWMNDQTIHLNHLEAQFRCPTLFGLTFSITGFEDLDFRNELARNIEKNGGNYSGDLTKRCTHLIAFAADGKKYDYATAWGLKVVSLKWYKDTLDRGMQLDEARYHPSVLAEHQGVGAWIRQPAGMPQLGKRQRAEQQPQETSRKLRRTTSARFSSQQNAMWDDIVGQRAPENDTLEAPGLRPSKSMPQMSLLSEPANASLVAAGCSQVRELDSVQPVSPRNAIFSNKHFSVRGFEERRRNIVLETLAGHGASLHSKLSELGGIARQSAEICYLIVPFEIEAHQLTMLEEKCPKVTILTELWLEWCISSKSFVAPDQYPLGLPITQLHLPASKRLHINATGFPQRQTLHISKLVKKLGAVYEEVFTPDTTLLLCYSANPNRQKIEHAKAWRMRVVTEKWLWQLIKSSRIPPFEPYLLFPVAQNSKPASVPQMIQANAKQPVDTMRSDEHVHTNLAKEAESNPSQENQVDNAASKGSFEKGKDSFGIEARQELLQEIPNVSDKVPFAKKKRMFQTFDGGSSMPPPQAQDAEDGTHERLSEANDGAMLPNDEAPENLAAPFTAVEQISHSVLINEFLEVKAAAAAKAAAQAGRPSKPQSKRLIGRALSNLSNASRASNEELNNPNHALSRASSINSINTDGLGMPLSAIRRQNSDKGDRKMPQQPRNPAALEGNPILNRAPSVPNGDRVSEDQPQTVPRLFDSPSMSELDFHAALATLSNSQPQLPNPTPEPQMGYADSEEAARLRSKLAEIRRRKARLRHHGSDPAPELSREESDERRQRVWLEERTAGSAAKNVIRDDEAVVGVGRRTRGREKALNALLGDAGGGDEIAAPF